MNTLLLVFLILLGLGLLTLLWLTSVAFRRSIVWGVSVLFLSPVTAIFFALTNWYDARKAFMVYIVMTLGWAGTGGYIVYQVGFDNTVQLVSKLMGKEITFNEFSQYIDKGLNTPGTDDLFADEDNPDAMAEDVNVTGGDGAETDPEVSSDTAGTEQATDADAPVTDGESLVDGVEPGVAEATLEEPATEETKADEKKTEVTDAKEETPEEPVVSEYPDFNNVEPDPLAVKKHKRDVEEIKVSYSNLNKYIDKFFHVHTTKGVVQKGVLKKVTKNYIVLYREVYSGKIEFRIYKKHIKSSYYIRINKP